MNKYPRVQTLQLHAVEPYWRLPMACKILRKRLMMSCTIKRQAAALLQVNTESCCWLSAHQIDGDRSHHILIVCRADHVSHATCWQTSRMQACEQAAARSEMQSDAGKIQGSGVLTCELLSQLHRHRTVLQGSHYGTQASHLSSHKTEDTSVITTPITASVCRRHRLHAEAQGSHSHHSEYTLDLDATRAGLHDRCHMHRVQAKVLTCACPG